VPAIATSVDVVVAIASAISPIIGGRAFTGNGRRFVPSGRRGVGCAHVVSLFNYHLPFMLTKKRFYIEAEKAAFST